MVRARARARKAPAVCVPLQHKQNTAPLRSRAAFFCKASDRFFVFFGRTLLGADAYSLLEEEEQQQRSLFATPACAGGDRRVPCGMHSSSTPGDSSCL